MIFVTVGTHEQQFNRLIEEVDRLKGERLIKEDVFIQTGFSSYEPQNCEWSKLISYKEMQQKVNEARIVITHGGPASFIAPLQIGKIPVVVPRQAKFNEHVNDHQMDFAKQVSERMQTIITVYDIENLKDIILNYEELSKRSQNNNESNNKIFCEKFENMIEKLFE